MTRCFALCALGLVLPGFAFGQDTTAAGAARPATLSLEEALNTARANNPLYLQTVNNAGPARWGVRNAYGTLLPSLSVSGGIDYTGAGETNFGQGFTRATSALIGSSYSAGLQWQLDGSRILAPGLQKSNRRATEEEISSQESTLKADVTIQYLTVRQASAQVAVARQQVERNKNFLDLANAKYRVGQGTLIEVRQAEVQKGQSDVQLLRNSQTENESKLELFRIMGVTPPAPVEAVALTDSFPVQAPAYELDHLLDLASEQNPALKALKARGSAASAGVWSAKSAFLPSLTLRAGWSGFTQEFTDNNLFLSQALASGQSGAYSCNYQDSIRTGLGFPGVIGTPGCYSANGLDATGVVLDPLNRQQLLKDNNVFPFRFTRQPFSASLTVSLPIFTGFGRSLRLAEARAQEQDADESVRARGLQVRTEVHSRFLAIQTAYQAIGVQTANREAARDQLRLAQDRYRLGSGNSLEVSDAQNTVQRAEGDYVNSVYDYHKALAALEAAVGRPLR
ncbi:MAG: TolC family protein [Gemmatimonadales bacterium]